jgi:hypothetical protein
MNDDHGSLVRGDESDLYNNCNSVKDDQVSADAAGSTRGNLDSEAVAISESMLNTAIIENLHFPCRIAQHDPGSLLEADLSCLADQIIILIQSRRENYFRC